MTTTLFELTAHSRPLLGSSASRRLRLDGYIPAILYGGSKPARPIFLKHNQIAHALELESFYSHILTIKIKDEGQETLQKAVLKDLQRHPFKPRIQHIDLLRVSEKEKITLLVPLHFKGEDQAPGVKEQGGILSKLLNSVEVRCFPSVLPEYIEVDVSSLRLDEVIYLSQLDLPKNVELVALTHEDAPVVNIQIPRNTIETTTEATTSAEVPAINVKKETSE